VDTTLTLERVTHVLDNQFETLIDLSDVAGELADEQRTKFLTRALAAFCITSLTSADPASAASSVTDGYNDQGIDALYFDGADKTLYLIQSKWSKNATKTLDLGSCLKVLDGVKALIRGDFSGFNKKITDRESEIRANLLMRSDVRVVLVIAFSSPQALPDMVRNSIDQFLQQQNNVGDTEIFSLEVFDLTRIYSILNSTSKKISEQIALSEWGTMEVPYRAYYGQVTASDVAGWARHGKGLLEKNIRFYRGATDVNLGMETTIAEHPEWFWYFNNGITILCSRIEKTRLNGDSRNLGVFDCQGVSVVNGAQTVGVIWEIARRDPVRFKSLTSHIHVRLISLEHCPPGFDAEVTRATNTQNRIANRDFAALDQTQQRLASEMHMDGLRYAFKSGDPDPAEREGCNIEETTVALACASGDISMAVQAKREVGQFWKDIAKPPYTTLFNEHLTARNMWRAVLILRAVSDELTHADKQNLPRGEMLAIHGNRFVLHRVFLDQKLRSFRNPATTEDSILAAGRESTRKCLADLAALVQDKYPNAYLANLFKNTQKCKDLDSELSVMDRTLSVPVTGNLFDRQEQALNQPTVEGSTPK